MKKRLFIKNAAILTATALITRTLGILMRVYTAGKIGTVGLGLFSLVMTVFAFCVTVSTSAVHLACTRLVTDSLAENNAPKAVFSLKKCMLTAQIISLSTSAAMYLSANFTAVYILKDSRCILPLKILALCLPFMSVSAVLRGYFFARRKAFFTAAEQIIEQVTEFAVFAFLVNRLLPYGIEYGCCAIVIGSLAAEVISAAYSAWVFARDLRLLGADSKPYKGFYREFLKIGVPVTASSCLRSGLSLAENTLIPQGLSKYGAGRETALSQYGEISGIVMPLLTFPDVFLYCFSTLMIPEMSDAHARRHKNSISHMAGLIFTVSCIFSIGASVCFFFFGEDLANLIFKNSDAAAFVKILSPVVFLIYMDKVVDGMLKGLGEQLHYLAYNIADSVLRVVLTVILLPFMGIKGVIVVLYASAILNSTLSMARLIKVAQIAFHPIKVLVLPVLFSCAAGLAVRRIICISSPFTLFIQIILFWLFYGVFALVCTASPYIKERHSKKT